VIVAGEHSSWPAMLPTLKSQVDGHFSVFNLFAFYNYVTESFGPINDEITDQQLDAARQPFRKALEVINRQSAAFKSQCILGQLPLALAPPFG
jgi:hypothetical protein